ncbi:MAG TPA: hypothetical protein VKX49_20800 [Bryobacteraceae bacterium]|nr:hypothetical protein [Bryobacteraceae bacterium]
MRASTKRYTLAVAVVVAAFGSISGEIAARAISANIQGRHMPFGTVLDPIFASSASQSIVGYTRCGDSAIWTGHYLAAESFRYKVTSDPDALANARRALAGLKSLVDVTGTDLLARCLVPMSSPFAAGITHEEAANGIHNSGQNFWIGNTSRDQYLGVFFGLSVAYDFVNQPDVRASVQALATRMLNFLLGHAWTIVMPDGSVTTTFIIRPDEQLTILQIGKQVNSAQFAGPYQNLASAEATLAITPVALESQDDRSSYFKFNLDAIDFFNLIRLEKDPLLLIQYRAAYKFYRDATKDHMNPHFNMIDRALNGPDATRDAQTVTYLNQTLQRPTRDVYVDLRGQYPSCVSSDQSCNPIPIPQRVPTDFLWQRSPFQLVGGGSGTIESAGIDYILPYWMARYYGVVPDGNFPGTIHKRI